MKPKYYVLNSVGQTACVSGEFNNRREALGWAIRNVGPAHGKKLLVVRVIATAQLSVEFEDAEF